MPEQRGRYVLIYERLIERSDGSPSWLWELGPVAVALAIYIIVRARWDAKPKKVKVGKQAITVKRGELLTTYAHLGRKCGVHRTTAMRLVKLFQDKGFISARLTHGKRTGAEVHLTVEKYETYQRRKNVTRTVPARQAHGVGSRIIVPVRTKKHTPLPPTKKRGRKGRKGEPEPGEFATILVDWYSEQVDGLKPTSATYVACQRLLDNGSKDKLRSAMRNYVQRVRDEGVEDRFKISPRKFFGERWEEFV